MERKKKHMFVTPKASADYYFVHVAFAAEGPGACGTLFEAKTANPNGYLAVLIGSLWFIRQSICNYLGIHTVQAQRHLSAGRPKWLVGRPLRSYHPPQKKTKLRMN